MTGTSGLPAGRRARLEQQRDQALRDLLELERQVQTGDVPAGPAAALRRRYERSAAEAMAQLDAAPSAEQPPAGRRGGWRAGLYAAAAAVAVVAATVVLPSALQQRPVGGFVSGNELGATGSPQATVPAAPPRRDLSKVSDAEMEAVVAANPDVIGMRLALAERYLQRGAYDRALPHYRQVLEQQPGNAVALASLGWVLLQVGDARAASSAAEKALARDPGLALAWWVQANVRLYGQDDPAGAIQSLQRMARLPLEPNVRRQVSALLAEAQARVRAGAAR